MLTLNDGRSELWQWDTGRKLTVDADCSQVHFSNKVFGRSIDVDVIDGSAIIPDILLQTDKDLNVWAFVGTSENGYTKISKTFKVNRRNKPADYVFTPTEQTSLEEIKEKIEKLESIQDPDAIKNAVEDYLEKNPPEMPGIPTITAERYSDSTNGTGVMVTTKNYNADGSVTIDSELVYDGKDGVSPTIGRVSVETIKADETPSGEISGPYNYLELSLKIPKGADGDDYVLTPEDKNEIAEIAAELVEAPDSGGNVDQSGLTAAQITALDGMFKVCAFIKADVSAEYNAFKTAFGINDSGEEETEVTISQAGSVLTMIGVPAIASVVQTGSVLTMT